jgi:hypothetical protein
VPKVFLITSTDLKIESIGSFYLSELINLSKKNKFYICSLSHFLLPLNYFNHLLFFHKALSLLTKSCFFQNARIILFKYLFLYLYTFFLGCKIRKYSADCIWLTASSPELMLIGERLSQQGFDLRLTIWDPPEYILASNKLGFCIYNSIMFSFFDLLKKSKAVSVVSDSMYTKYTKLNKNIYVVRYGVKNIFFNNFNSRKSVRIIFAGSLYSKNEWNALILALDEMNWTLEGRKILLYFAGNFPMFGAIKSDKVIYLGRLTHKETILQLKKMHIGYLPYWFSQTHKKTATMSFPGKLSTYLECGLVVFNHSPKYTEISRMISKFQFGVSCNSSSIKVIRKCLLEAKNLLIRKEGFALNIDQVVTSELSSKIQLNRFNKFISKSNL